MLTFEQTKDPNGFAIDAAKMIDEDAGVMHSKIIQRVMIRSYGFRKWIDSWREI